MAIGSDQGSLTVWEIGLGAAGFLLTFVIAVITATWALGRDRAALGREIEEAKSELKTLIDNEIDAAVHSFGETISAIRQKMTDIELWNRDNFVGKDTFKMAFDQLRQSWQRLEDKIDRRFDQIDEKLQRRDGGK